MNKTLSSFLPTGSSVTFRSLGSLCTGGGRSIIWQAPVYLRQDKKIRFPAQIVSLLVTNTQSERSMCSVYVVKTLPSASDEDPPHIQDYVIAKNLQLQPFETRELVTKEIYMEADDKIALEGVSVYTTLECLVSFNEFIR